MNWKEASRAQLLLICSEYEDCPVHLKVEAAAELKRRNRNKHQKLQQKLVAVYPR